MPAPEKITARLLLTALVAAAIVVAGTVTFVTQGLPEEGGEALHFPITKFKFAFGSGIPLTNHMRVEQFANGYALLSSGPISITADQQRRLSYTWKPPGVPQEAAFFWRRSDDPQNIHRSEIGTAGNQQLDLSTQLDWHGEITEIGFLFAGVNSAAIEVGDLTFTPDSLNTRLQLSWGAWTAFENWSQSSINFLHGGDGKQIIALPLLITAWLLITLTLFWLIARFGKPIASRQFLISASMLFLIAWVLLDIRWASNNLRQVQLSFQTNWQADEQQRSGVAFDGDLYQYIQRIKNDVLGEKPARILVIGDEHNTNYYVLRAKYHLLPHSVDVAGGFAKKLNPESLDYVVFFGQPGSITRTPGWGPKWRTSLTQIDRGEWGAVYRSH
jgi:hypothetical protein